MKEVKKYKLCPDSKTIKEPKKIRLESNNPHELDEIEEKNKNNNSKYDAYCPDSEEIYVPGELKNKTKA